MVTSKALFLGEGLNCQSDNRFGVCIFLNLRFKLLIAFAKACGNHNEIHCH